MTKDVGKKLETIKGKNISFEDCQKRCAETQDCHSFGYCSLAQNCHLFDRKLDGSEELKAPNGCFSSYKHCKNGNTSLKCSLQIISGLLLQIICSILFMSYYVIWR